MQPQPNDTATAIALQPGREMDAVIAETVIGACAHRDIRNWYSEGPDGDHTVQCGQCHQPPRVPSYSTRLTDAMLIVEHKRRDGWVFSLQALPPDPANADNMLWECVFQRSEVDGGFQEGHGATAPEAICRAALAEIER